MKIDDNPVEVKAMSLFKEGKRAEANGIQDEFLAELRGYMAKGGDHCPCAVSCAHHGNCVECVAIHRGHGDHLPDCLSKGTRGA